MPTWTLYVCALFVVVMAARLVVRSLETWLRRRDDLVWQSVFAQRNPRASAGEPRTTDRYDFDKAVAGRRRWMRRTASGRVFKSPQQLRRESAARRAPVERIDAFRRAGGER